MADLLPSGSIELESASYAALTDDLSEPDLAEVSKIVCAQSIVQLCTSTIMATNGLYILTVG